MQENNGNYTQAQTAPNINGPVGFFAMSEADRAVAMAKERMHFALREAQIKLSATIQTLAHYGTAEDHEAACTAVARIAAKAMRRR